MPPSTPLPPLSCPTPDIDRDAPSPDRHRFAEHVGKTVVYTPPSENNAAWYTKPIHKQGLSRWGWRRLQRCKSGKPTHRSQPSEDRSECNKPVAYKMSSKYNSAWCHTPDCQPGFRNWEWQGLKEVHKTCSLLKAHWRIINTRVRPVFFCLYMR